MAEKIKNHNRQKDARETAPILKFLLALAENKPNEYAFLKDYSAEIKEELAYIEKNSGKECHDISDMRIGIGRHPILYKNAEQEESHDINAGCDFVLSLREAAIRQIIAEESHLSEEDVNLRDWPKIYIEITDCICQVRKAIWSKPNYKGGRRPWPSEPNLTDEQIKEDIERQRKEALTSGFYVGDSDKRQWARKIAEETIQKKIDKYKDKEASAAEIWLLIPSQYFMEIFDPLEQLLPYLVWQAAKQGLENFAPFSRLIIATSQGFLVFNRDFCRYEIWPRIDYH